MSSSPSSSSSQPPALSRKRPLDAMAGGASGRDAASTSSCSPVFDGSTFFCTRVTGEPSSRPALVGFRDLISPMDQVSTLLLTAMYTEPAWLAQQLKGFAGKEMSITCVFHEGWLRGRGREEAVRRALPVGKGPRIVQGVPCSGGIMHAKLILVRFKTFLRVAVVSANLGLQWEWSRDVVWAQDFPVTPPGPGQYSTVTDFKRRLRRFCEAIGVPRDTTLEPLLEHVSFMHPRGELIPSVPSTVQKRSKGEGGGQQQPPPFFDKDDHGHLYMQKVLSAHKWPAAAKDVPIVSVSGSLGDLKKPWLRDFVKSLTSHAIGGNTPTFLADKKAWPPIHVLHPTNETIWTSHQRLISTINMNNEWWVGERGEVPRHVFYDCKEKSEMRVDGVHHPVHHMKALLRTVPKDMTGAKDELVAWLYLGSHNLSRAAWGHAPSGQRGVRKGPGNVELGVLLTTRDPQQRDDWLDRYPLMLPGQGATPYNRNMDLKDRDDPRCPFTSGRGWDSIFSHGRTGRMLYMEGRAAFFVNHHPDLKWHQWHGGQLLQEGEEDVRSSKDEGEDMNTAHGLLDEDEQEQQEAVGDQEQRGGDDESEDEVQVIEVRHSS